MRIIKYKQTNTTNHFAWRWFIDQLCMDMRLSVYYHINKLIRSKIDISALMVCGKTLLTITWSIIGYKQPLNIMHLKSSIVWWILEQTRRDVAVSTMFPQMLAAATGALVWAKSDSMEGKDLWEVDKRYDHKEWTVETVRSRESMWRYHKTSGDSNVFLPKT